MVLHVIAHTKQHTVHEVSPLAVTWSHTVGGTEVDLLASSTHNPILQWPRGTIFQVFCPQAGPYTIYDYYCKY